MIYPKRKKVPMAASGMNTEQIEAVDNAIITGTSMIPGAGTAIAAGLTVGKMAGTAIEGDGQNAAKNAIASVVNPLSSVNSLLSGNFKEAIPVFGAKEKADRMKQEAKINSEKLNREANLVAKKRVAQGVDRQQKNTTYADGGELPESFGQGESGEGAVVLGGKLHEEGGNPIVDQAGNKVAETEREELLLSAMQTDEVEKLVARYKETKDDALLTQIGQTVHRIVNHQMKDFSNKFKS